MSRTRSPYLAREARIRSGELPGIIERWKYGRDLQKVRAGRQQLPHGFLDDRVQEAERAGIKGISRQELQRRLRFTDVYDSEGKVRQVADALGSWSAIVNAGFPPVEATDPEDLEAAGISTQPPDAWEQLPLIPGFGDEITVRGRKVPIADATVADAKAYRENFRQMHENFGKTLAQIEASVEAMVDGSGGDDDANAVEAWKRGTGIEDEDDDAEDGAS